MERSPIYYHPLGNLLPSFDGVNIMDRPLIPYEAPLAALSTPADAVKQPRRPADFSRPGY